MITSLQFLTIMFGSILFSLGLFALYRVQTLLNAEHRQRVFFLRFSLAVHWIFAISAVTLFSMKASSTIVRLMPSVPSLNRTFLHSTPHQMIFENDHSILYSAMVAVYVIGVLFLFSRLVRSYLQIRKNLLSSSPAVINGVDVRVTSLANSPFSFGFLNPQVFIPDHLVSERMPESLHTIVAHEQMHVQHRDPQWKLISLVTQATFFFIPTVWVLHRQLELEMEIVCDQETMRTTHLSAQVYGNVLIDAVVAQQTELQNPMFAYMSETHLSRRIHAMKAQTVRRPVISLVLTILALATGVSAIAATTGATRSPGVFKITAEMYLDGKLVSSPQIISMAGHEALIETNNDQPPEKMSMKIVASDSPNGDDGISLALAFEFKTAHHTFRSKANLIMAPGEPGSVVVGADESGTMEMRVRAVRQ